MRSLFVMDPLDTLDLTGDSTFALMCASTTRGWDVWWCHPNDMWGQAGRAFARAQRVVTTEAGFDRLEWAEVSLAEFQFVWMRKDPPFDMTYIFTTYLLDLVPKSTLVLNEPAGIRSRNEKLFAAAFTDLTPPTLISRDLNRILAFAQSLPDRVVLKPWDGNGGRGVLVSRAGDPNLRSMIEVLTDQGRGYILAQRYLPEIVAGDKRIILIDGEPAGAVLRVPGAADHRGNLHVGATAHATTLTEREREICARIGPILRAEGLLFVGIDVIGGWLTEINVTSPTGIHQINRFDGVKLEERLLDAAVARYEARA
ncbi:glutathione synthetase [Deltaproteobacteria bacterium]|nr:glutathione synthetase [Deltaproteobacteria bacterium]